MKHKKNIGLLFSIVRIALLFLIMGYFIGSGNLRAQENLDELNARKSRLSSASWGYQYLEDASDHYHWQNETVMYNDIQTDHEVWRMSTTPNIVNYYHNDIGVTPWSADGKRMAFISYRGTGAFSASYALWMVVDTDGKNLRPIPNGAARERSHTEYFHWSPQIPDVYYEFWRDEQGHTTYQETDLMKCTVSNNDVSSNLLIAFPTAHGSELFLNKTISGDGRKVIAMPWVENWNYPATIYPEASAGLDDPDGYTVDRNMDPVWGDTPSSYDSHHDQYYAGNGAWWFIMPSGTHAWWRLKVLGSAADGGSRYSFSAPSNFNEQWPENTVADWGGTRDPFGSEYWSHFVPDRWGRYALFSNTESFDAVGTGIWDIMNHQYSVESFQQGCQHHDWHGFTDWTISTSGGSASLTSQKYNDVNSIFTICNTHVRYNGGSAYNTLPRPAQSPDGTKVAWHSEFLNSNDATDIFWTVVMYPHPPTNLDASNNNGVEINWLPPKYSERGWPYAESDPQLNSQGWPLTDGSGQEIGEPLYAREIKAYHVWRSPSGNSEWTEVGSVNAQYAYTYVENSDLFMLHPVVNGLKVDNTNKISFIDHPPDGTYYYAVTSEEHSGLESRKLSEIVRVTVNGGIAGGSTITQSQGQTGFWTTAPSAPGNLSVQNGTASGHFHLSWVEPQDSKIRYYNIYYSSTSTPPADQRHRIASVPVGTSEYLDWCAVPGAGNYRVTSVDRYGNEGTEVYHSSAPGPPQGVLVSP
jgi:hypothetical protein